MKLLRFNNYLSNLKKKITIRLSDLLSKSYLNNLFKRIKNSYDHIKGKRVNLGRKRFIHKLFSIGQPFMSEADVYIAYGYLDVLPLFSLSLEYFDIKNEADLDKFFSSWIYKYFPTFVGLRSPETILKYRNDYIKLGYGDFAEVIPLIGSGLVYMYDFEEEGWYIRKLDDSFTMTLVDNSHIFKSLRNEFDPTVNKSLGQKLSALREDDPELATYLEIYFTNIRNFLDNCPREYNYKIKL